MIHAACAKSFIPRRYLALLIGVIIDMQVKDGRWGNLTVPIVPQDERNLIGADVYGRMRSPWNVNDRKYLSRGLGEMCGLDSTDFCKSPVRVDFDTCLFAVIYMATLGTTSCDGT